MDNLKVLEEIKTTINKNVGSLPVYCNTDKLEDEIELEDKNSVELGDNKDDKQTKKKNNQKKDDDE